jgi:outer membrane protein TolC
LSTNHGWGHRSGSTIFEGQRFSNKSDTYSGSLSLSQNFVSFPIWAGIRSAGASREATRGRTQATRADIALQANQQFYALLKAIKLATVARQTLLLSQNQLKRTEALFELGSVAKGDVLKQQVLVSQAKLDDINTHSAIEVERARLVGVLGMDPGTKLEIDTTLTEATLEADSATVWRDAFANRPELAAARASLASARASLGGAQGRRYPSLSGNWSYGYSVGDHFPKSLNEVDDNSSRSVSFGVSLPLFDGRNTRGAIQQAKARKLQAEYAVRDQELAIGVDVEAALQAVSQARERIQVASDEQAAADEDLKLSQEKYDVGSATVLELIDAQVALTRARSDYISALADAQVARMQLRRARGERF